MNTLNNWEQKQKRLNSCRYSALKCCYSVTWFEVAVEHGFAAHVVFVGDFLSWTVVVLQVGAVDGSDQRLTQVQLIDLIYHKNTWINIFKKMKCSCSCWRFQTRIDKHFNLNQISFAPPFTQYDVNNTVDADFRQTQSKNHKKKKINNSTLQWWGWVLLVTQVSIMIMRVKVNIRRQILNYNLFHIIATLFSHHCEIRLEIPSSQWPKILFRTCCDIAERLCSQIFSPQRPSTQTWIRFSEKRTNSSLWAQTLK